MERYEFTKTFLAKIRSISEIYENPREAENAMKRMMMKTRAKIHAIYIKDLIQTLYKRRMGTPEVFNLTKILCKNEIGDEGKAKQCMEEH